MQRLLAYQFRDQALLKQSLTHRSVSHKHNNERLEYLGDALLGFIIAEALYKRFPDAKEGELTRLRAGLIKKETLAALARKGQLSSHLKLGKGELKSNGRQRDSILANTMEALIGAIYLDSNLDCCRDFVLGIYADLLQAHSPANIIRDPKTALQEYLQAQGIALPVYTVIKKTGLPHNQHFTVSCAIKCLDREIIATGKSKRIAEQSAAERALDEIETKDAR